MSDTSDLIQRLTAQSAAHLEMAAHLTERAPARVRLTQAADLCAVAAAELIALRAALAAALDDKMALIHRANRAEIALTEAQQRLNTEQRHRVEAGHATQLAVALAEAESRAGKSFADYHALVERAEVAEKALAEAQAERDALNLKG